LIVVTVRGPEGANYEFMAGVMDSLDHVVSTHLSEVTEAMITVTSPGFGGSSTTNSGFARHVLKSPDKRGRTQEQIARELGARVSEIPGAEISVRQPSTFAGGGRGLPVQYIVQNQDFSKIEAIIPTFLAKAAARPELTAVDVDLVFKNPELRIEVDRNRAESLGVPVGDIANVLQATLSGQRYGYFLRGGRQYEIIGQLDRDGRSTPLDLALIQTRSDSGALVGLDNLARFVETSSPPILYRYNRFSAATFGANLAPGHTLGAGVAAMRTVADEVLDDTFSTALAGEARELDRTGQSLAYVFLLSLLLVYLVLSAQFESFRSPIIIMTTVPLALVGGLFALWYTGQTVNIFSQIGLIMLIGLVTKNGILLVEFANQRLATGLTPLQAATEAAASRFRPILMTAISTLLGTLPIALALGAGAKSRVPLGIAVIGGLLVGTVLTLYVIPAVYSWLAPKRAVSNV
jgi:multidrug efflux pump